MEFFETRMGHEFYLGTMPKMVKAIEETNRQLARLTEKLDKTSAPEKGRDGVYPWANYSVEDSVIDAALEKAENDDEGSFFSLVTDTIDTDCDGKASCLFTSYRSASEEERRVIDGVFVELTGWSLATLIRQYAGQETEIEEE